MVLRLRPVFADTTLRFGSFVELELETDLIPVGSKSIEAVLAAMQARRAAL